MQLKARKGVHAWEPSPRMHSPAALPSSSMHMMPQHVLAHVASFCVAAQELGLKGTRSSTHRKIRGCQAPRSLGAVCTCCMASTLPYVFMDGDAFTGQVLVPCTGGWGSQALDACERP